MTWNNFFKEPFGLHEEDWVHFAEFNDIESVKKVMDETGARIIILEMVQGEEGGNLPASAEFVDRLWALARERNAVIIDDEVQAGFGRTAVNEGDWFACTSYGVVPDIMAIGKSFGGGYPVTAVVTNREVSESMEGGYDGSTFGGNPMAMTAALIATRQMREKNITENVIRRGEQFRSGLEKLREQYPVLGDIRGRGLMVAFSLGSEKNVAKAQKLLKENGVKSTLGTGKYLRILPPTIISEVEVKIFLDALDKSLDGL